MTAKEMTQYRQGLALLLASITEVVEKATNPAIEWPLVIGK